MKQKKRGTAEIHLYTANEQDPDGGIILFVDYFDLFDFCISIDNNFPSNVDSLH